MSKKDKTAPHERYRVAVSMYAQKVRVVVVDHGERPGTRPQTVLTLCLHDEGLLEASKQEVQTAVVAGMSARAGLSVAEQARLSRLFEALMSPAGAPDEAPPSGMAGRLPIATKEADTKEAAKQ